MTTSTQTIRRVDHWIGGAVWRDEQAPEGAVTSSATGELVTRVALGDARAVDAAVAVAAAAAEEWGTRSLGRRAATLFRFRELLERRRADLAELICLEHGKLRADADGEIARGLEVVEFACGLPHLLKGEASVQVGTGVDTMSLRMPLGVTAGITPFNFPAMVPLWLFPVALACGNAFILKPSEQAPSAALLLAELLAEAGVPDGVFNVVNGDRRAADAILAHPGIAAVSFVGSTAAARHVYETASRTGKRVQALGGAKNHAVVMPDADLDGAVNGLISAAYGSSGQRCMAISVAVAVGDVADALVERLVPAVQALRVGPAGDPAAEVGPLISAPAVARVEDALARGVQEGAELLVDGRGVVVDGLERGHFTGPSLLDRVTPAMDVYQREIFGPVLAVVRAGSYEEALAIVNANPYGNGAVIYTRDGATARSFELGAAAGLIGVNVPVPVPVGFYSFGGWKASLFGDTHVYGPEGIHFNTRGKVVTRRFARSAAPLDLSFPTLGEAA